MTTHHPHETLTEAATLAHMEAGTLPIHFTAACADRSAAQLLAARLGADWTITFDDKAPQKIECIGRRVSGGQLFDANTKPSGGTSAAAPGSQNENSL